MKQTNISKPGGILIIGVTVVGLIAVGLCYRYGPLAQQYRNMDIAREHGEILLRQFASDPRFASVEFHASTSEDLVILGTVDEPEDLADLKTLVSESDPPCGVSYVVQIRYLKLFDETKDEVTSNKSVEDIDANRAESSR